MRQKGTKGWREKGWERENEKGGERKLKKEREGCPPATADQPVQALRRDSTTGGGHVKIAPVRLLARG